MYVPPDVAKHSEILAQHIRWIESTEDWKDDKSKLLYRLEGQQNEFARTLTETERARHEDDRKRQGDRHYLELEFAKVREEISLLKRDQRHTISIAIVVWVVLTTLIGLAIRFL